MKRKVTSNWCVRSPCLYMPETRCGVQSALAPEDAPSCPRLDRPASANSLLGGARKLAGHSGRVLFRQGPVPCGVLEGVVVVVPALPESQPANPPVVAALVARGVGLRAPGVRGRVDEPGRAKGAGARSVRGSGSGGQAAGSGSGLVSGPGSESGSGSEERVRVKWKGQGHREGSGSEGMVRVRLTNHVTW